MIVYELESGFAKWTFPTNIAVYENLKFSADNKWLAVWGVNLKKQKVNIEIWDIESGSLLKSIITEDCYDVAFSKDGAKIAEGIKTRLSIWDTSTWTEIKRFDLKKYYAGPIDFSEDGKTITVAAYRIQDKMNGEVTINVEFGEITPGIFTSHSDEHVFSVSSPDGSLTVTYRSFGLMIYINSANNKIKEILLPAGRINSVIFSPDQSFIFMATMEGQIYQLGLKN